jgi:DNA-binding HxlR family transcriptional regulator
VRYGQLKRRIPEASQRMLTLQLRQLERDGLLKRSVHRESVLRTQYELTSYGRTLVPALESLSRWGRRHRARRAEAEVAFDELSDRFGAFRPRE